jgi:4-amino-4-deoxy-L-arabinose transferase-like glycosyltransferase
VRALAIGQRDTLLVALAGLLLFLPGIAARDLWNPDEPRYAQVAREMLASGEFLVPHLNGEVYTQKPPLLFWSIAAFGKLRGGVDEVAARLPSLLAGIAALVAAYWMGRDLFGRRTGWIAAAILGTCNKILWQARVGQIDMLLVALVAWAFWSWIRAWRSEDAARARALSYLGFFLTGLGTIAKGPVALLPPLLGWVLFAAWRRDRRAVARLHPGTGLLIWAATVLAWLVPAGLRSGGGYIEQIAFRQTVTRYAEPWHHFQPWYYYLTILPVDFFPWSLLAPGALLAAWRGTQGESRDALRLLLCWVVATLVFFSLSPAKRTVYILTLYPGLAVAIAAGFEEARRAWPAAKRWFVAPLLFSTALFAAAALAAPAMLARRAELKPLGTGLIEWGVAFLVILASASLAATLAARGGRLGRSVAAIAAGMGLAGGLAAVFVLPRLDVVKSPRALTERLAELGPQDPFAMLPRYDANVVFHAGRFARPLDGEEDLRRYLAQPRRVWLFAKRNALAQAAGLPPLYEAARDPEEREGYLLLSNQPMPTPR